jgi:protein-ribulosamine 3-kinase
MTIELPPGTKIKGISPSGASYWARTAKIEALDANGAEDDYFVKASGIDTMILPRN